MDVICAGKMNLRALAIGMITLCLVSIALLVSCKKEEEARKKTPKEAEAYRVAAFVPGVVAGSPLYEQLVSGAEKAVAEYPNASLKVIEGGFNQAEWGEKITSLAATGEYNVIITSNPAMPFVILDITKVFPDQKFICFDAFYKGNSQIYTVLYNQVEQAYFLGYLGGLITGSSMTGANSDLKVGMIVAQQYPALDKMIVPGYKLGLQAVDPAITMDFRVIGNWYDANKAADLANSMIDSGVDVIATIAGGANQGVINACRERGKYVLYFDSNELAMAPGVIVGCGLLYQEKLVSEVLKEAIQGKVLYGEARIVTAEQGYVDFVDDDPLYIKSVAADVREAMDIVVRKIRSGELRLAAPEL